MSWAEVKKINSNLSKPLDEILNDSTSGLSAIKNLATDIKDNTDSLSVFKLFLSSSTSGTPTTSTPLTLSISGAGKLYGMTIYIPVIKSDNTSVKTQVIITIDNQTILDYSVHGSTSSSTSGTYGYLLFSARETLLITRGDNANEYYGLVTLSHNFLDSRKGRVRLQMFSPAYTDTVSPGDFGRLSCLTNAIPFNNCTVQVKAKYESLSSSATINALYTLD